MISSVNQNLEARRRDVRFGFHRGWCSAWVQVEYGPAISASSSTSIASKAPVASYSATASSTGAGGEQPDRESFERRRKAATTVAAMSGATQPLDEALLERDSMAAASPSAV